MARPKKADSADVECIVMHPTNIQLSCGKMPFRSRVVIPRAEYDEICALDEAARRPLRLEAI